MPPRACFENIFQRAALTATHHSAYFFLNPHLDSNISLLFPHALIFKHLTISSVLPFFQLSVGIENGVLESYNSDFELQFSHPLKHIVGMCRIAHKQSNTKSAGNGFLQLKAFTSGGGGGSGSGTSSNANGLKSTGTGGALTTSTSYGSLSSSAALREREREREREQAALAAANGMDGGTNEAVNGGNANNFMEFLGPITGLVYLMKDPRDPLLHIYLFECEAVEEVSRRFYYKKKIFNIISTCV